MYMFVHMCVYVRMCMYVFVHVCVLEYTSRVYVYVLVIHYHGNTVLIHTSLLRKRELGAVV